MSGRNIHIPECMVDTFREKALEYQAKEERQQELEHFSNTSLLSTLDDILKYIRERRNRTPYSKLSKKFPNFCDKYPALSKRILANPEYFKPGGQLRREFEDILKKRQELISNPDSRNKVEGDIYNTYIAPRLPK